MAAGERRAEAGIRDTVSGYICAGMVETGQQRVQKKLYAVGSKRPEEDQRRSCEH